MPLVITDYTNPTEPGLAGFMVSLIESDWQTMDILRADPHIKNVKDLISDHRYTDIYTYYASDELVNNLKTQLGVEHFIRMDSPGAFPIWQIKLSNSEP